MPISFAQFVADIADDVRARGWNNQVFAELQQRFAEVQAADGAAQDQAAGKLFRLILDYEHWTEQRR